MDKLLTGGITMVRYTAWHVSVVPGEGLRKRLKGSRQGDPLVDRESLFMLK